MSMNEMNAVVPANKYVDNVYVQPTDWGKAIQTAAAAQPLTTKQAEELRLAFLTVANSLPLIVTELQNINKEIVKSREANAAIPSNVAGAIKDTLGTILPEIISAGVTKGMIDGNNAPVTATGNFSIPATFVEPEAHLPYMECRRYVSDIIMWACMRWRAKPEDMRFLLYGHLSNEVGFDIRYMHHSYKTNYGGNLIDMIEDLGYARICAAKAYSLWGLGDKPDFFPGTTAQRVSIHHVKPVGERKGMPFTQRLSARAVGRLRRPRITVTTQQTENAAAHTARFKKQQKIEQILTTAQKQNKAADFRDPPMTYIDEAEAGLRNLKRK